MPIGAPKIRARPFAQVNAQAIAPSGTSPEAIWHAAYDTQTFTSASTTSLDFFAAINADKSLSNMEAVGQFPAPQVFELYNFTCDLWPSTAAGPISNNVAGPAGSANDLALLLFTGRPFWRFIRMYFVQFGFLDGMAGLVFCLLQAFGTYLKWGILWEWRANAARGRMPSLPEFDEDDSVWRWREQEENAQG